MKRTLILILFVIAPFFNSVAQESSNFLHKNSLQLELGGHGLIYSFNYERILVDKGKHKTAGQIGVAYYPASVGFRDFWMPVGINQIYNFNSSHHFEAGLGMVLIREALRNEDNEAVKWFWDAFISARLGYRYQKPNSRFLFRVALTPVLETYLFREIVPKPTFGRRISSDFHFLAGVSVGYSF
ncbi:hypothetical protein [Marivirga sp.]|uniref:hypothetical protein n=1 Tax=Marivirga sp. TaxID=2018662 RepID=UPI003DA754ED